ncbi:hypothetical protein Tcan_00586, partial [Toxocara canis]
MKVASMVGIGKITEAAAAVPFIYTFLFVLTFLLTGAMQGFCGKHCFIHARCSVFSQARCKALAMSIVSSYGMFFLLAGEMQGLCGKHCFVYVYIERTDYFLQRGFSAE